MSVSANPLSTITASKLAHPTTSVTVVCYHSKHECIINEKSYQNRRHSRLVLENKYCQKESSAALLRYVNVTSIAVKQSAF